MSIYHRNADNPASVHWTTKPAVSVEDKKKTVRGFANLPATIQQATIETWEREASSEVSVEPTVGLVAAMTNLITDLNKRSNASYDARKEAIVAVSQGSLSEDEIRRIKDASGLSAKAYRDSLHYKDDNGSEKIAEGVSKDTITFLDELIKQGKAEAAARKAKAAANKAAKGDE